MSAANIPQSSAEINPFLTSLSNDNENDNDVIVQSHIDNSIKVISEYFSAESMPYTTLFKILRMA